MTAFCLKKEEVTSWTWEIHIKISLGAKPPCPCEASQCVGVIRFVFFMFSNFYRLDLHNKTCVALANLQRRSGLLWFNCMVIENECLLTLTPLKPWQMFLYGWLLVSDNTNIHVYVYDLMILDTWKVAILCEHILTLQRFCLLHQFFYKRFWFLLTSFWIGPNCFWRFCFGHEGLIE